MVSFWLSFIVGLVLSQILQSAVYSAYDASIEVIEWIGNRRERRRRARRIQAAMRRLGG